MCRNYNNADADAAAADYANNHNCSKDNKRSYFCVISMKNGRTAFAPSVYVPVPFPASLREQIMTRARVATARPPKTRV